MIERILCIGDSNTYGYDPADMFGEPYKKPWPTLCSEKGGYEVFNHGVNGALIHRSEHEFETMKMLINKYSPLKYITVMLGTNDIWMQYKPEPEQMKGRLEKLLENIKEVSNDAKIILMAPPEMIGPMQKYNAATKELADIYKQLSQKYEALFVNLTSFDLELTYDGVHLSENDHYTIAENLLKIL